MTGERRSGKQDDRKNKERFLWCMWEKVIPVRNCSWWKIFRWEIHWLIWNNTVGDKGMILTIFNFLPSLVFSRRRWGIRRWPAFTVVFVSRLVITDEGSDGLRQNMSSSCDFRLFVFCKVSRRQFRRLRFRWRGGWVVSGRRVSCDWRHQDSPWLSILDKDFSRQRVWVFVRDDSSSGISRPGSDILGDFVRCSIFVKNGDKFRSICVVCVVRSCFSILKNSRKPRLEQVKSNNIDQQDPRTEVEKIRGVFDESNGTDTLTL